VIGKVFSHYKILENLGKGGMGVVSKAQDLKPDRLPRFIPTRRQRTVEVVMIRLVVGLAATLASCMACIAQEPNEDVILTSNGGILRGTITDKITPGGAITVLPAHGKPMAAFWSELVSVRRLPMGIPDSVLRGSFDHHTMTNQKGRIVQVYEAPRKSPKFDFAGFEAQEDVLFLVDGSILRGALINQRNDGVFSVWTSDIWKEVGGAAVVTNVRVPRGIPDSTLVFTYLKVPEHWRAGELRIFSIHGGFSVPLGDLATPQAEGRSSTKIGPALAMEAGIRLWPGIRWLTSGMYSRHPRDVPQFFIDATTGGSGATPLNVFQFMTGFEARTFSSSDFRVRFAALAGIMTMSANGYEATFPQTFRHLAGTAEVEGFSSSSFGFALSGGLLAGRFSLDFTWTYFKPEYTATTNLYYEYGYISTVTNSAAESAGFLVVSLGFSIY